MNLYNTHHMEDLTNFIHVMNGLCVTLPVLKPGIHTVSYETFVRGSYGYTTKNYEVNVVCRNDMYRPTKMLHSEMMVES